MLDFVRVALLGLWSRKGRTVLTVVGILIAVSLMAGTQFAVDTTQHEVGRSILNLGDDIIIRKGWDVIRPVTGTTRTVVTSTRVQDTTFDPSVVEQILSIPGVVDAVPRLTDYGSIGNYSSPQGYWYLRYAEVYGVLPERDWLLDAMVVDSGEVDLNGNNSLVSKTLADDLGISVGTQLNLTFRELYLEDGNYTEILYNVTSTVTAIYHYPSPPGFVYYRVSEPVYLNLTSLQRAVNKTGVNMVAVKTYTEGMDVDTYIENSKKVETRIKFQFQGYSVYAQKAWMIASAQQGFFFMRLVLMAPSALTLVVSIFLVVNVMLMSLEERKTEVGILRSMGASNRQIFVTFMSETVLLGVLGTTIGILSGLLTSRLLLWSIPGLMFQPGRALPPPPETIYVSPLSVAISASMGLIVVLVAGWIPSRQATRITVNEALRPMMRSFEVRGRGRWFLAGLILTVLGAVGLVSPLLVPEYMIGLAFFPVIISPFLMISGTIILFTSLLRGGFGFLCGLFRPVVHDVVTMIRKNIARASRWYKLTFAMLSLSLILLMVISSGITSGVNLSRLDLYLNSGSDIQVRNLPFSNATQLREVEGVDELCTLMRRSVLVNQTVSADTVFLNESTYLDVVEAEYLSSSNIQGMSWQEAFDYLKENENSTIVTKEVAENLFIEVGQHYNLTVSQQVYREYGGMTSITYSVVVKVIAIVDLMPGIYLPRRYGAYQNLFITSISPVKEKAPEVLEERWTLTHMVKLKPASTPSDVAKGIRTTFPESYVTAVEETAQLQYEGYVRVMQLVVTFLSFSLATSVIGLVISLLMSISERRREFGIMRAIGMSRRQALLSVMVEAVVVCVIAYIAGILCSTAIVTLVVGMIARMTMPYLSIQMIFTYGFPWMLWLYVLLGVVGIAVVASAVPAYKTSRMNVVDAIRYG
ncbi:MAG: ABC transporter permease [Candidatus Bathyarchaeia archaeon]